MLRSWCSSVVTLTSPETAATMMTMTVIESISFRASRRGISDIQTYLYYRGPELAVWEKKTEGACLAEISIC